MPVLYKDFDKEVNDFFNKYYLKGTGGFKFENKSKGANQEVYVNPVFDKGNLTVNFHYDDKARHLKTKLGLVNNQNVVAKATYESGEHKVELTDTFKSMLNLTEWAGELAHEWKTSAFSLNSKSKFGAGAKCTSDIGLSVGITKEISAGGQVSVNCCDYSLGAFKAGLRFQCCNKNMLAASYDNNGAIAVAFMGGMKEALAGHPLDYAALVNYSKKGTAVTLGAQTTCCSGQWRAKSDLAGNYGVAYIRKFANNVTATVGVEGSAKSLKCPCDKLAVSVTRDQ